MTAIIVALPTIVTAIVVALTLEGDSEKNRNYYSLNEKESESINQEKKQRTCKKNEAKKIKSNDLVRSNRDNSNIATANIFLFFIFWVHQYNFRPIY